jgi:uroporphyrinogen-III synthase
MTGQKARILSTRPLDPSLAKQAADRGVLLESLSFIETTPVRDEGSCRKIAALAKEAAVIVFTSMNAADAVAGCLTRNAEDEMPGETEKPGESGVERGVWIRLPGKIFCIGSATKQRVIEHFGEDRIAGTADSAAGLADTIIAEGNIEEVVFFCSDQRRDELPKRLWEGGIRVKELVAYHTKATPHPVWESYDGVVFFSPSAVSSFFSVNTLPAETTLFAIGHTTAEAIREYCINPVIIGESTGKDALIRQVIDHFGA